MKKKKLKAELSKTKKKLVEAKAKLKKLAPTDDGKSPLKKSTAVTKPVQAPPTKTTTRSRTNRK